MEPEENSRDSGLTEIWCGTREKAKFLDCEIRDVTSTWEAGFAKILTRDAVLEKKKRYSGQRWRKVGIRDCSEKGTGRRDQGSPLFTLFPDPDWVELMEGMEFNLCRM